MRKLLSGKLSLILLLLLTAALSPAQVVDPSINWRVMKLPHFDLIYDAEHQNLANLYADRLEESRQVLGEYYSLQPDRVSVILSDRTDLTNGYATPIPYRTIMLFPVLPNPLETISEYDDWARELAMHEYAHILSFEPRRNVVKALYYTFGSWMTPNILLPRWWLEGIAVDLETRTSNKGRLRSAYQDASIRAYVIEDRLKDITLAEIAETGIHTWPQGGRPYLFGSLMWSEMLQSHGTRLIQDLHWRYGGRIPWFIEGPIWDYTQKSYQGHFAQMQKSLTDKVNEQLKVLRTQTFSAGPEIKIKNGMENFSPRISPDGLKMILISKDDTNRRSVQILKRATGDKPFDGSQKWDEIDQDIDEALPVTSPTPRPFGIHNDAPPGGTIVRMEWSADSQKFIFDKLDEIDRFKDSSDLHIYDLKTKKSTQLTKGERAREASLSPDGKLAAFVKLQAGNTALGLLEVESKTAYIIYQPELQTRISSPSFLSADEIVFSMRKSGREHLYRLKIGAGFRYGPSGLAENRQAAIKAVGAPEEILTDYPESHFPQITPLGLTFISSKNGTQNLYLASKDLKTAQPLTHSSSFVGGGTYDPALQEIYVSELTTRGFQIRRLPAKILPELPKVGPLLADRYPQGPARSVSVIDKPQPVEYSAWKYMLPHYWFPNLYFYDGGSLVGGTTGSSDPLSKHAYSLTAAYDSKPDEPLFAGLYMNNQTEAVIVAEGYDFYQNVVNTASRFRFQQAELSASWQMIGWSKDLYLGVGWNYTGRNFSRVIRDEEFHQNGPKILGQYSDLTMSGAQISPEGGQSVKFEMTSYLKGKDPSTKQERPFQQYNLSAEKYFAKWLPKHHAIMMRWQSQYLPQNVELGNYAFTMPYNPFGSLPTGLFILRGYKTGTLLGKTLNDVALEYRLPIHYVYRGAGTSPLFIRRLHAAIIGEGAMVDGFAFNPKSEAYERVANNKIFASSGIELKADITLGYSFPLTLVVGAYYVNDPRYYDTTQQFVIGLQ